MQSAHTPLATPAALSVNTSVPALNQSSNLRPAMTSEPASSPALSPDIDIGSFRISSTTEIIAGCKRALKAAQGIRDFRFLFSVEDDQHVRLIVERDPEEWFATQYKNIEPDSPIYEKKLVEVGQLLQSVEDYVSKQIRLDSEEFALFTADSSIQVNNPTIALPSPTVSSPTRYQAALSSRPQRCREVGCNFSFDPQKEVMAFIADPSKQHHYRLVLSSRMSPSIVLFPMSSTSGTGLAHTNEQMCIDPNFWQCVEEILKASSQTTLPLQLTMNFGKWESAISRDKTGLLNLCHGHCHIDFPLKAADGILIPDFKGRTAFYESYRLKNVQLLENRASFYHRRVQNIRNQKFVLAFETLQSEVESLKKDVESLKKALNDAKKRIDELESQMGVSHYDRY